MAKVSDLRSCDQGHGDSLGSSWGGGDRALVLL